MIFLFRETGDNHAKKGVDAANQSNFRQAIQEIEAALKKGVKTYTKHELLAILGRSYHEVGENEKAVDACLQATEIAPNYPAAWTNMGIAYRSMGKFAEAETCYLQAIQVDPNYAFAHSSLGALYIFQGEAEKAKNILEQSIQINPNINVAYGNLALAFAMLGEFDQANATLKQAIFLGYKNWQELGERIQALAASAQLYQQPEQRVELEPVEGFPFFRYPFASQAVSLTLEADQLSEAGMCREAINLYQRALSLEPNCSYTLVQLGLALQEQGRVFDAIQNYALALKIDPDFSHAYYARGWAKNYFGDYEGELEDARIGFSLDPENRGPYLQRIGTAYLGMKKYEAALDAFSQAFEINSDKYSLLNKGICYWEMGDYRKAVDEFTNALVLDPEWDLALLNRARAYVKLGNPDQALKDIDEVLRLNPNHPQALELRVTLQ